MSNLTIALSLEYGAQEYIWSTNFENTDQLLSWWNNLYTTDIYTNQLGDIINTSELTQVDSEEKWVIFYACRYHIMLENDFCSYLIIDGKRYNFRKPMYPASELTISNLARS